MMGSTIYYLPCQFYDVLILCFFLLLTSCVYTCGLECSSDKGNIEGTSSGKFYVCVFIFCFMFRDGFCEFDLSKDEKSSFVCDGVSCPNVTG